MPKPAKPQIASANDLLEGHVLYLSGDAVWTPDRHSAFVSTDADELGALADKASRNRQADDGDPRPVALREVIRDRGPTIRTDLGRQADHTIQDGQARNV